MRGENRSAIAVELTYHRWHPLLSLPAAAASVTEQKHKGCQRQISMHRRTLGTKHSWKTLFLTVKRASAAYLHRYRVRGLCATETNDLRQK